MLQQNRFASRAMAAGLLAVALPLATMAQASADGNTPPWEPSSGGAAIGTLTFYDASGSVVTGGQLNANPFASYAVASAAGRQGDTKATLYAALPVANTNPGNWTAKSLSTSTDYPVDDAPEPVKSATTPVVTIAAGNPTLQSLVGQLPNTSSDPDYAKRYQLRLRTSAPGVDADTSYFDADIVVDTSAGTWTEIYPVNAAPPAPTTTTLTVSPAGHAQQGHAVTLTATVTGSDAGHPSGTVKFKDGNNEISGDVAIDGSGVATFTTSSQPAGTHSYTAVFSPQGSIYSGSTSNAVTYRIDPVAKRPVVSGTIKVGHKVSCSETVDFGVKAAYGWAVGGKNVASSRTYTIPGSAAGKKLTCTVSLSVGGGPKSSATSASKMIAKGSALKATTKPAISGTLKAGHTVTASHGKWSPTATSYSYHWYVNGKSISGATHSTFKIPTTGKGKTVTCKVTAHKRGYADGHATTKGRKVAK